MQTRVRWRHGVEKLPIRAATVRPGLVVPLTVAQPRPGGQARGGAADRSGELLPRARRAQFCLRQPETGGDEMDMGVVEARHQQPAPGIDDAGPGCDQGPEVSAAADGGDAISADGDCVGVRQALAGGPDGGVEDGEVDAVHPDTIARQRMHGRPAAGTSGYRGSPLTRTDRGLHPAIPCAAILEPAVRNGSAGASAVPECAFPRDTAEVRWRGRTAGSTSQSSAPQSWSRRSATALPGLPPYPAHAAVHR
jgi:hypothetical protein